MNDNNSFKTLCEQCEFVLFNPWNSTKRMFLGSSEEQLSVDTHCLFNDCVRMDKLLGKENSTTMYDVFVVPYLNTSPDTFDEKSQTTILDKYELYGVLRINNKSFFEMFSHCRNPAWNTFDAKMLFSNEATIPLVIVKYEFTEEIPDDEVQILKHYSGVQDYLKRFKEELFTPVLKEGASLIMREIVRSKNNAITKTQKR